MPAFSGFPEGSGPFTSLPGQFFQELLPSIDHLGELKLILYIFWRLGQTEDAFRYLRRADILDDEEFMQGLGDSPTDAQAALDDALERCVQRGTLLSARLDLGMGEERLYFLNSPKGRAALDAIARGEWRHTGDIHAPVAVSPARPNIYRLYEENIGPLTPLIAEQLRDAEQTYPAQWIEDALRIAVENNARRWSYVEAILKRWQEGGRDDRKDRRDTEKDRRRFVEGEFSEFIEH
jgi:DnaD/phage-associated family protein